LQVARGCWGSPVALKLIGGSLSGQPIAAWKNIVNFLSKGRSIVDSNAALHNLLRQVLEDALHDNHLIKGFVDLGLFFEDKRYLLLPSLICG
jgi:hypothetical protein